MLSDYALTVVSNIALLSMLAASAYVILLVGELSFGQQGFFAIGAYSAAVATTAYGCSLVVALLTAVALGAGVGALLGAVCLHLRGFTFSLSTLAFAEMVRVLLGVWHMEGGPSGVDGFGNIRYAFESGLGVAGIAVSAIILCLVTLVCIAGLEATRTGRTWRAIGEDADLAAQLGLRPRLTKIKAVALSGSIAGLAGGMFAHAMTFIEPSNFGVMLGIHTLAYVLIGGTGHVFAVLIGVSFDVIFLESLRAVSAYRMVIFGGVVALLLRFRPQGILDVAALHKLRVLRRQAWRRVGR